MTLIEHRDLVQGSQEWLDARLGMVTASVVGKLVTTKQRAAIDYYCTHCGASVGAPCISMSKGAGNGLPIKTLHEPRTAASQLDPSPPPLTVARNDDSRALTALLVAERITGYSDPVYVSDDMLRGQMDEPIARDLYSQHFAPAREVGFLVLEEPGFRLGYSPDGLVDDEGLIEIKSRRQKKHLTTILRDEVPPENVAQLQAGLLVTGRAWIDYVSFCAGLPLWVKRVYPDQRWFDAITEAVTQFEETARLMLQDYEAAIVGLPKTERTNYDLEMVV